MMAHPGTQVRGLPVNLTTAPRRAAPSAAADTEKVLRKHGADLTRKALSRPSGSSGLSLTYGGLLRQEYKRKGVLVTTVTKAKAKEP